MSTSESYDATKLLNNLNITNWDHHLREKLSAYPIMGKAIRKGIPYEVIKPTVDDLFEDGARMYSYREDSTNLDNESRKDFLSACTTYEKNEARRNDEEAKICAFITSKMLLRSNKTYVLAADDNDSFAMYTIAKAAHTRVTSFAVAQHAFENLFKITTTGTFATYSDALSNARLTFDAIFDPTATGTMPIDNTFTMMIVNGLPVRFRYMKDRLYSQDLNGAFPTYDLNNRSIEPPSATPSGPTILAATTDVQPICTICRKPFPRVLSKVSGLPFQRCQPCNYKARNPTVATAPTVPTPAQVTTAQGQLKKAQAVLLAAKVDYNVTSATEPLIPPPTSRDADSLNRYMQSQNYSLTATATTVTSPNYGSPSDVLADMPWLSDSGATYSSTNNLSDPHRSVKLPHPVPITGAGGTIIYAVCPLRHHPCNLLRSSVRCQTR